MLVRAAASAALGTQVNGIGFQMAMPLVALVGRPNVGKSTLFNRITGKPLAIVADEPGTTRDRLYAPGEWSGRTFMLIDTGGLEPDPTSDISDRVRQQAEMAIA